MTVCARWRRVRPEGVRTPNRSAPVAMSVLSPLQGWGMCGYVPAADAPGYWLSPLRG